MGTKPPQAATIGPSISDTTSPTPPVECLSTTGPGRLRSLHCMRRPESRIANAICTFSSRAMPLKYTAMVSAEI